jgi:hypothetical protein
MPFCAIRLPLTYSAGTVWPNVRHAVGEDSYPGWYLHRQGVGICAHNAQDF